MMLKQINKKSKDWTIMLVSGKKDYDMRMENKCLHQVEEYKKGNGIAMSLLTIED